MHTESAIDVEWAAFTRCIGSDEFLEKSAAEFGALRRRRAIRDAPTLLRLAMLYAFCGNSLRQTAAYSGISGIAELSNVAVLKRVRACCEWVGFLLASKLAERSATRLPRNDLNIRIVDATTVNRPGTHGTDFRIHVGMNLRRFLIDHIEITDSSGGESFSRFEFSERDLVIADRGYPHPKPLAAIAQAGAFFLVRVNWQNIPLEAADGSKFDILAALRSLADTEVGDFDVVLKASNRRVNCRLIGIRKSESAAAEGRKKALAENGKKSRAVDVRTLESAGYTYVLTNLDRSSLASSEALDLYRFRWQIEMTFKRLKSVLDLGKLPARDPRLARTYLLLRLLAAIVIEDLSERYLAFFPWGYPIRGAEDLALEALPDLSGRPSGHGPRADENLPSRRGDRRPRQKTH